jgi:hypothetical protein
MFGVGRSRKAAAPLVTWALDGPSVAVPHSFGPSGHVAKEGNAVRIGKSLVIGAVFSSLIGVSFIGAESASASAGICAAGEVCLFYNSGYQGATFSDGYGSSQSPENYGAPNWYVFSGGNGAGVYVKNNAASVFDYNTNYSVTIYYNSNNTGPKQYFKRGTGGNLNDTLKNNNASQCYDFFDVCP